MAEVWRAKIKGLAGFEKRIVIKTMLTRAAAPPRAGRDVRQRGVAGRAAQSPEHRRRVRLRPARGALLHRHVVRAGADPALRAPAHGGARRAAAGRHRAARHQGRVRGAAARARAGGRQRRAGARAPRSQPRQHHHVDQRHRQADRLRRGARHGADAAEPAVRRPVSLRGARAHPARGRGLPQRRVFRGRHALRVPDRRAPVQRLRRRGHQGGDGGPGLRPARRRCRRCPRTSPSW